MKHVNMELRLNLRILAILGTRMKKVDFISIDRLIRRGMSFTACERVMKALDMSKEDLSYVLGISQRKLSSIRKLSARLPLVASDRLYRIARILALAIELTGDEENARSWLKQPQYGLGERIPLELLDTQVGADEVEDLIGRIEHGVLS